MESANDIYRLLGDSSEYFLLENRQKSGFDAALPGAGLLLWHIDETKADNNSEWYPGCATCNSHYKVAMVQADGLYHLEKNTNGGDGGDPFPGSTGKLSLGGSTAPSGNLYNGSSSGFSISEISPSGATMTATVTIVDTLITTAPPSLTNNPAASISFNSPQPGSTFECRLDAGTWTTCTPPANVNVPTDGSHTFSVRAKDNLGTLDATPATVNWVVDTLPPETFINSGPNNPTTFSVASFAFSSAATGTTFSCRLDAAAWIPCISPASYSSIPLGEHTFEVFARDLAGNSEQTPASWNWTVATTEIRLVAAGQPDSYFTSLATALSSFPTGSSPVVSLQALTYTEAIDINRCGEEVTLAGGYSIDFSAVIGTTVVTGPLVITCGALTVNALEII
ncbi:MAG: hypothetical protein CVU66_01695 [Deltaproteobacteria bacterium HGW-Deltaproteobacteria-23]|nr:MAG: hypothetical protein CVU66_01695 [Deltaproteobacteria bacterium HGW-Deltaproteobacteria-23]